MRAIRKTNETKSKAYLQGVEHQKKIGEAEWTKREKIINDSHDKEKLLFKEALAEHDKTVREIELNTKKLVREAEGNFKREIEVLKKLHAEELKRKEQSNREGRRRLVEELDSNLFVFKQESDKKLEEARKEFLLRDKEREEALQKRFAELDKEKQAAIEERERWENENDFMLDLAESYFFTGKDSAKKYKEIIALFSSLEEIKEKFTELRVLTKKNASRVKRLGADVRKRKLPFSLRDS